MIHCYKQKSHYGASLKVIRLVIFKIRIEKKSFFGSLDILKRFVSLVRESNHAKIVL